MSQAATDTPPPTPVVKLASDEEIADLAKLLLYATLQGARRRLEDHNLEEFDLLVRAVPKLSRTCENWMRRVEHREWSGTEVTLEELQVTSLQAIARRVRMGFPDAVRLVHELSERREGSEAPRRVIVDLASGVLPPPQAFRNPDGPGKAAGARRRETIGQDHDGDDEDPTATE